jgi:hypothetical protein
VSRQWLYTEPALRQQIQRLRALASRRPGSTTSARTRSTEASLQSRLRTALDDNRRLRSENAELNAELALAYGRQRDAAPLHWSTSESHQPAG